VPQAEQNQENHQRAALFDRGKQIAVTHFSLFACSRRNAVVSLFPSAAVFFPVSVTSAASAAWALLIRLRWAWLAAKSGEVLIAPAVITA
jgi:hypothetical protein